MWFSVLLNLIGERNVIFTVFTNMFPMRIIVIRLFPFSVDINGTHEGCLLDVSIHAP